MLLAQHQDHAAQQQRGKAYRDADLFRSARQESKRVAEQEQHDRHQVHQRRRAEHGGGLAGDHDLLAGSGVDQIAGDGFDLALKNAAFTAPAVAAAGGGARDGDLRHIVGQKLCYDRVLCHAVSAFLISREIV